jgi:tetratricopeptide (TPR) repeat protein
LLGASIYFNGRRAIVDADRRAEAIGDVQHALSLAPNFAPAHATLALIEGEQSQMAEAPLRRAVALDPSYSEAWNWLGNSLNRQGRLREAIAAYQRAIAIDPLLYPAVINLFNTASDAGDQAAISRLLRTITKAGASGDLIVSLNAEEAYRRGDFSASLKLLSDQGLDGDRHSKPMVWSNWFDSLTALGLYGDLHRITGCPEWYAPLVSGEALPPTSYGGKAVTPEEFWTSMFFSAPASRAMVRLGKSRDLVRLYRQAYRNADDFILQADRRDMLPELAPNLASALRADGSAPEASYVLAASSERLERALSRSKGRDSLERLARIRAAQGEKEQAVTLLDAALRRGWFPDGRSTTLDLAQEPAFDRLRGDARFEALRQRVLDHVAKERAELGHLQV